MKNEDMNSCVYAVIQLLGHSPKTVSFWIDLQRQHRGVINLIWNSTSTLCTILQLSTVFNFSRS